MKPYEIRLNVPLGKLDKLDSFEVLCLRKILKYSQSIVKLYSLFSHSWWNIFMNVRRGSTILHALGVSKNYSVSSTLPYSSLPWHHSFPYSHFISCCPLPSHYGIMAPNLREL